MSKKRDGLYVAGVTPLQVLIAPDPSQSTRTPSSRSRTTTVDLHSLHL
ncbi:MAG: hypothetical protein MK312_07920 [Roseibacillus sp.]|nr:hypothetical protein [Roseibacillus sp.]